MRNFNFIKGVFIGIAKIVPGFSGAVLMMSFNLYDKAILAITNFFDDVRNNFFFLLKLCIGIIIGIVLFSNVIAFFIHNYYLYTYMFFIGLIFGGVPVIKGKFNTSLKNIILLLLSFFVVLLLSLFNGEFQYVVHHNIIDIFVFFVSGFLEALGTVVPGISSTALLMMFGVYSYYINVISHLFLKSYFISNVIFMIPFSIGMILGIIIISILIRYLFKYYYQETFAVIFGFSFGSIFILFMSLISYFNGFLSIIISLILFVCGFFITYRLS